MMVAHSGPKRRKRAPGLGVGESLMAWGAQGLRLASYNMWCTLTTLSRVGVYFWALSKDNGRSWQTCIQLRDDVVGLFD